MGEDNANLSASLGESEQAVDKLSRENAQLRAEAERFKKRDKINDWKNVKTAAKKEHVKVEKVEKEREREKVKPVDQNKLIIGEKQIAILTMGVHGVLHVLGEEVRRRHAHTHA